MMLHRPCKNVWMDWAAIWDSEWGRPKELCTGWACTLIHLVNVVVCSSCDWSATWRSDHVVCYQIILISLVFILIVFQMVLLWCTICQISTLFIVCCYFLCHLLCRKSQLAKSDNAFRRSLMFLIKNLKRCVFVNYFFLTLSPGLQQMLSSLF